MHESAPVERSRNRRGQFIRYLTGGGHYPGFIGVEHSQACRYANDSRLHFPGPPGPFHWDIPYRRFATRSLRRLLRLRRTRLALAKLFRWLNRKC
jgi:hypothetical protein